MNALSQSSAPILITGASGFIGANLCRYFARRGYRVIAIAGTGRTSWRLAEFSTAAQTPSQSSSHLASSGSIHVLQMDLANESDVRQLLRDTRPQAIFNLAAYGAYSNQTETNRIYHVNFDTVRYLLEGARELYDAGQFRAFVQAGSSSEYGLNCKAPLETDPTLPDSNYAVSKVAASSLVQFYGKKFGFPAWSFRLYSVYGPFEDASRLILKLLIHARDGKLPPLVNPRISRDFVYVDDVGDAFDSVLNQADRITKGEIFNIGTGQCVTLETLIEVARQTFSIQVQPQWGSMPDRHWDHPDWYSNSNKAATELGWRARTSLSSGLEQTMKWIHENQSLLDQAMKNTVLQTPEKAR